MTTLISRKNAKNYFWEKIGKQIDYFTFFLNFIFPGFFFFGNFSLFSTFFFVGNRFKKTISNLEEELEIKTTESLHYQDLVAKMEATPGQDEMNKVQIADLKHELSKAEENLKIRTEELLQSKKDLRLKDEEIQQREIDISCLRGQVNQVLEVLEDDDDTLEASDDDSDVVLLEDLEWDPQDIK